MPFCLRCSREIVEGSLFCPYCGEKIGVVSSDSASDPVYEEDLKTFIGRNAEKYLRKFQAFGKEGEEGFAFTWNWPAFWLGFVWMLYRKMYLWSLVAFIIALTPIAYPLTMIAWGITGNYLYFRMARKKILEYRSRQSLSPSALPLEDLGGVNRWVWIVGVILFLFLLTLVAFGFLLLLYFLKHSFMDWPNFIEV
jgi:hypothetical protein